MAAKPGPGRPIEIQDPVLIRAFIPKTLKRKVSSKITRLRKTNPKTSISSVTRDALEAYVAAEPGGA